MKIDCKNLGCPEPVIRVKKALEELEDGDTLEVEINSNSAKENIKRFAKEYHISERETGNDEVTLLISKDKNCKNIEQKSNSDFLDTTLFLKDDKVGDGELGSMLVVGFMNSILEQKKLPKRSSVCKSYSTSYNSKN